MHLPLRTFLLTASALSFFGPAMANPLDGQVARGSASISGEGSANVQIHQSTSKAIINWRSFDIGVGETTRFIQPGGDSVTLNRITGGLGTSRIDGTLKANGNVFLVNPDGILFGATSIIDVGGLVATTSDIADDDFMAGQYRFTRPGRSDASVVNEGQITIGESGIGALVAPGVRNAGVITATLGDIGLTSTNSFTLDFYGDELIKLTVGDEIAAEVRDVATGQPLDALVKNEGTLKADGGRVALTAAAARAIVDSVINNTGVIEADTIGFKNGRIVLGAATATTKPNGAPVQKVKVSGKISAAGKEPGEIGGALEITGEAIELASASIDGSGHAGGGTVLVGGDIGGGNSNPNVVPIPRARPEAQPIATATTVMIDADSTIDASATETGDGGKVVVWADGATDFEGSIVARGGSTFGDGGFVEVSGKETLSFTGIVDLLAFDGENGTLLLDPLNAIIGASGLSVASLQAALATSNVVVNTGSTGNEDGDITVAESVTWNGDNELLLDAHRNVTIADGVTIANVGAGDLALRADSTGTGVGTVDFLGSGQVDFSDSTGIISIYYNPALGYALPTDYATLVTTNALVDDQLIAYMLVNDVLDLQAIEQNLAGTYALGKDIDATPTATWNAGAGFLPIGDLTDPFIGQLIGSANALSSLGGVIDGLTINSLATRVGLFGYIGPAGSVSGMGLTNATITGDFTNGTLPFNPTVGQSYTNGGQFIGGLAGQNDGTITNSFVEGSVNASSWGLVGGLVGWNGGVIVDSRSGGSVGAASTGQIVGEVGGLVADNQNTIEQSYSTASVSGVGYVGGLVGFNGAQIQQSFATGPVTVFQVGYTGGLVGASNGPIIDTYSTGSVGVGNSGLGINHGYGGGLVGINGSTIAGSYSVGAVSDFSGVFALGALIGVAGNTICCGWGISVVTDSYWDTQTTPQSSAGGTGQTTAQLKAALPGGFHNAIWALSPSVNNGYPHLLWETDLPPDSPPTTLFEPPFAAPPPPPDPDPPVATTPALPSDLFGNGQAQNNWPSLHTALSTPSIVASYPTRIPGMIDPGLAAEVLLYALIAQDVYNDDDRSAPRDLEAGTHRLEDWETILRRGGASELDILLYKSLGFYAAVYGTAEGEIIIAYRGTEGWTAVGDWTTNALVRARLAPQYDAAARLAEIVSEFFGRPPSLDGWNAK